MSCTPIKTVKFPIQAPGGCNAFIKVGDTIPKKVMNIVVDGWDMQTSIIRMRLFATSFTNLGSCEVKTKVMDVTNGSGITVISETQIEIDEISAENNKLPAGTFKGDFKITNALGVTKTFFNVEYTIID